MSGIRRANQGGSIVTFVVVGFILASVLIGGVYLLTQRSEQARREEAIAAANKQAADNAKKSTTSSSKSTSSNTSKVSDSSSDKTSTSTALPTTGPELTVVGIAGVYFLTVTIVGYSLSRRNLMRYLAILK